MRFFQRILLLCFAGLQISLTAVSQIDTAEIYRFSRHVPFWKSKNVEKLSATLAKDCSSDEETVLAFSHWICKNIKLDYSAMEKRPAENKTIKKILWSKKALSDGYVKLFVEMCKTQKIPAIYVPGYTKDYDFMTGDTLFRTEYAWALVNLSENWYIMDLTAASSKVVAWMSPMSKFFWTLFKIPYSSHLRAVKSYNPSYLYMNPATALKNHLPAAEIFQLMHYPMTISDYMGGDSLMQVYFENYPETQTANPIIDEFYQKSAIDKYIYVANESEFTNPANQYTKALYYYFALKNFFNTYYIESKGKIFAPLEESEKAWKNGKIADSLFTIAAQNNIREMETKQTRSEKWKNDLITSNKLLSMQLSTQAKVNSQQIKAIGKINSQNKKILAYIAKNKDKYALRDIVDLQKPMIQSKDLLDGGTQLINNSYESLEKKDMILKEYDSLILRPLCKANLDTLYTQQQSASKLCNTELASLSRYLDRKGSNLSLVYYSDKYVLKKSYFDVFSVAGEINDTYTDPALEMLAEKTTQFYELIQNYVNENVSALQSLKKAKVMLANDYGEDDLYEKTALAFNAQLDKFTEQINVITEFNEKLSNCLSDDVTLYKDVVSLLQNDNSMENYRHKEYSDYRKGVKQAENDKIKYYQGTIRNYQKFIAKSINVK